MGIEIERKFLLDRVPDGLPDEDGTPIAQGYLGDGGESEVRLRRGGERLLLTVKRGAGQVRDELEVELEPELFDRLWPLTEGRRLRKRRHLVELEGARAEVDVYEGDLAGLLVAEVEFGDPERAAAFQPPPWFGPEITGDPRYANRNLALAGAPPSPPLDAGEREPTGFRLRRREPLGEGLARVARGRCTRLLERLEDPDDRELAAAVHGARKDLKKARAVLRACRPALGKRAYREQNRRLRDAGRLLSGSRDTEVKLRTLVALQAGAGAELPAAEAAAWERALRAERDAAAAVGGETREALSQARAEVGAARDEIGGWALEGASWELLGDGLERSYRTGRRALGQLDGGDAEAVHEWRKRAKDLWYQVRLVEPSWPALLGATAAELHELSDLLGDHHDLAVLAEDLGGRPEIGEREALGALIAARQEELLVAARELGARLYAEKPGEFRRRLRSYWRAWR